jgi:hypothetical protein
MKVFINWSPFFLFINKLNKKGQKILKIKKIDYWGCNLNDKERNYQKRYKGG